MSASKHPFDYDLLDKGSVIPVERIEELSGVKRDHAEFALHVLKYQKQIERELEERGNPVTVRSEKGSLFILTDPEAAEYGANLFRQRQRQLYTAHKGCLRVDQTKLDEEQLGEHQRNVLVQGAKLAALRQEGRRALEAHKRATPGVPKIGSDGEVPNV